MHDTPDRSLLERGPMTGLQRFLSFDERQLLGIPIDFSQETGRGWLNGVLGNRFGHSRYVSVVRAQAGERI